jgi:uncharacterized protein
MLFELSLCLPRQLWEKRLVVIFKPTLYCNIKCKHCYVGDLRKTKTIMSYENARTIIAKLPDQSEVVFHGGEPTLMGVDFYRRVAGGFLNNRRFSMQTNLTLIDNLWIPFIKEILNNRISTSFDYLSSLRPIDTADWLDRIRLLKKNAIYPYVVSIFWNGNQHMSTDKIYSFFNDMAISFRLNYVENIGYAVQNGFVGLRHDPGHYSKVIRALFDRWFMSPDANIIIDPCAEIMSFFLLGSSTKKCPFSSKCYAHIISVNPDGDVYPCGGFDSFSGFKYGNLLQQSYSEVMASANYIGAGQRIIKLPDKCQNCLYFHICEGGCRLEAYSFYKDIYKETSMCKEYKEIFSHIENKIAVEKGDINDWWMSLLEKRNRITENA